MFKRLLVLMAKQPAAGRTKSRLSPPLSPGQAAELYRAFLADKLAAMRQVEIAAPAVAYLPATARGWFAEQAPGARLLRQRGAGLAARLRHAFDEAFQQGYERVIAIDGDTPTLPAGFLRQGFLRLDEPAVDVVLGSCEDGGYYAIGMKASHPTLFEVEMSTAHVTTDTLHQGRLAGLRVELLPTWYDVDVPADLERLIRELDEDPTRAPATARFLVGCRPIGAR